MLVRSSRHVENRLLEAGALVARQPLGRNVWSVSTWPARRIPVPVSACRPHAVPRRYPARHTARGVMLPGRLGATIRDNVSDSSRSLAAKWRDSAVAAGQEVYGHRGLATLGLRLLVGAAFLGRLVGGSSPGIGSPARQSAPAARRSVGPSAQPATHAVAARHDHHAGRGPPAVEHMRRRAGPRCGCWCTSR